MHAENASARKGRLIAELLGRAAQLLLPQLLSTYQATMMAEDRACLLAMKALDRVRAMHGISSAAPATPRGFLQSTGYLWGALWQEVHAWSSMHPALLDGLLWRPDMVDPRFAPAVSNSVTCSKHWHALYCFKEAVYQ